jgi:RAB protein geranylgeranyltransferase component A
MEKRGNFNETFWSHEKEPKLCGTFTGFMQKKIDGEDRKFAVVKVEGVEKPYLCGGRDLLNKLQDTDAGRYVEISFVSKDTFTPKGTKKKVPINRFDVAVEAAA